MNIYRQEEAVLSDLTSLYESRGYKKYKPSCFEEYSLYLENKDFLLSKNVLTFNGANGRLLALRPDVTLSIVTRTKADINCTEKLFYTEKVYRQISDNADFKEISQTGVEVIGKVDDVCQIELTLLIAETLSKISDKFIIDLSHMGFTEGLVGSFGLNQQDKAKVYGFLKTKNLHDFESFAESVKLSTEKIQAFKDTVCICGNAVDAIRSAKKIAFNAQMSGAVDDMERIISALADTRFADKINVDFSVANNADYYNGITFNGYLDGVPKVVLSGGRYDYLLSKMGINAEAIGFALYLGEIESRFKNNGNQVDYLIIYSDDTQNLALKTAETYLKQNKKVRLSRQIPSDLRYGKIVDLTAEN